MEGWGAGLRKRLNDSVGVSLREDDDADKWTCRSDQTVVFGVTADPVPHDSIVFHDGQSAIFKTDANRIDVILAFQLFELQARVRRIALEETICALGVPLRAQG